MLDIDFIRKNSGIVKKAIEDKGIDLDIDELLRVDQKRRQMLAKVEELRQQRNEAAGRRDVEKGREVKRELETWSIDLQESEERLTHLMLYVPNIPSVDSPVGKDAAANQVVSKWGHIPEFDFDIKNPLYLTGTSEPALLAYYMDEVIEETKLPIKVCAMTKCYRSEVGDYGKDTRGLYRVHEFDKVEQVVICRDDLDEIGRASCRERVEI